MEEGQFVHKEYNLCDECKELRSGTGSVPIKALDASNF